MHQKGNVCWFGNTFRKILKQLDNFNSLATSQNGNFNMCFYPHYHEYDVKSLSSGYDLCTRDYGYLPLHIKEKLLRGKRGRLPSSCQAEMEEPSE